MAIPFSQLTPPGVGVVVVERVNTLKAPLITIEEGRLILRPFQVSIDAIEVGPFHTRVQTTVIPRPGTFGPGIRPADGVGDTLKVIFMFPSAPLRLGPGEYEEDMKVDIRHALHEVMKHEIDECLRNWDGSHVSDPHAGDR